MRASVESGKWRLGEFIPTEEEIADRCELSRGTVRQAIRELVQEGYLDRQRGKGTMVVSLTPRAGTRALPTNLVAMVVPYLRHDNPVILLGAERRLREEGFELLVVHSEESVTKEADEIQHLIEIGVRGVLLYTKQTQAVHPGVPLLHSAGVPFVFVDRFVRGIDASYVVSDNEQGGYLATRHLLSLGHSRVAFVSAYAEIPTSIEDRLAGYTRALIEAGVQYDPSLVKLPQREAGPSSGPLALGELRRELHELMGLPERPTAVFCTHYHGAVEIVAELDRLGLQVPADVAVVAFDNPEFSQHVRVPLTTIEQDFRHMGRVGADLLVAAIRGQVAGPKQVLLPVKLIVKQSCHVHQEVVAGGGG